MPHIQVGSHSQLEQEANEAYVQSLRVGTAEATKEFERVASELAGPDETLRRILLARLDDAYYLGQRHEKEALHARFNSRYRLGGSWVATGDALDRASSEGGAASATRGRSKMAAHG